MSRATKTKKRGHKATPPTTVEKTRLTNEELLNKSREMGRAVAESLMSRCQVS